MKASARSIILVRRSAMLSVMMSSVSWSCAISSWRRKEGDDAGNFAAGSQGGSGYFSHQADAAAAVNQPTAALGYGGAENLCGLVVARVFAEIGAAVDDDVFHFVHYCFFQVALLYGDSDVFR